MPKSPTAEMLAQIIDRTDLTQREIAQRAGFVKPNVITMMKQGEMKVPLDRIPALARACDVDPLPLLSCAMHEYMPDEWAVIRTVQGEPVTRDETALLRAYRAATFGTPLTITPWMEDGLVGFFDALRNAYEQAASGFGNAGQARGE